LNAFWHRECERLRVWPRTAASRISADRGGRRGAEEPWEIETG